ncbi:MAG: ABC transporter substrate-binding protein [Actinomycetota bacterium]|nr:ABC transporter substrate-binding protein [Actinomycetota bacterium]
MVGRRAVLWLVLAVLVAVEPNPVHEEAGAEGGRLPAADGRARRVLRVGITPVGGLDPAQVRSIEQALVVDQLFDSLTAVHPTTLEPVPALAARWESSPDQRLWTFFLRPGASFANGRAVTAADVKYSYERVARRGSGSPGSDLLRLVSGYTAFRTDAPELVGVAAPAPDVVQIALDEPWGVLPSVLASPVLSVVPAEAVEAAEPVFADAPVGSGPFRVERLEGGVLSLVPVPGAEVSIDGVDFVQFDDVGGAYRAFTRGEVDWARVPPQDVQEAARRYGDGGFRPYVAQLFYGFNLGSPKLADARFREAIVRAIDRRAIVAAVYQGTVRPLDGVVVAGVPGHQPAACARCAYDPARSKALLAELFPRGTPGPPEVGLDYDADPTQEALARAVQANLAEVGLRVTLRPQPVNDYDDFALSGRQEVFRLGWIAAYPSPDAFLSPLFMSGSPDNLVGFARPDVDEQLRAARAEANAARRVALFQEAERAILDQVPVIPVAQLELHSVVSERARNLRLTALGTFDASTVALAGRR